MPFLSYHMKIDIEASSFPRSCRNPRLGSPVPMSPSTRTLRGSQQSPWWQVSMMAFCHGPWWPRLLFRRATPGLAASGTWDSAWRTPPPQVRSKDFGPIAWGRAAIPLPLALRPRTAGGLLGSKQAALRKWLCWSLWKLRQLPRGPHTLQVSWWKTCVSCYLLTSEADTSLAGAAGAAWGTSP